MKVLLSLLVFVSLSAFAEPIPGIPSEMVTRNNSTTSIGTAYTAPSGEIFSNMAGKKNFSVYNGSSTVLAIGVRSNSCSSSTDDHYAVPGSTGLVIENVAMAKAFCVRALGGASAAAGTVYFSVW